MSSNLTTHLYPILPASFFLLSKQTSNKKSHTSSIKSSWPRGPFKPSLRLETNARVVMIDSKSSRSWDGTQDGADRPDRDRDIGLVEKGVMHMYESVIDNNEDLDLTEKATGALTSIHHGH